MKSKALIAWLVILFVFSGSTLLVLVQRRAQHNAARTEVVAQQVNDHHDATRETSDKTLTFVLTDQAGEQFSSESLRGKIWIGSIFYSSCPGTCRAQNLQVARLQKDYASKGVEFVSITCDPQKDTPQTLADYASLFNAKPESWHFLTGDFGLIEKIGGEGFGIVVAPQTHSDRLVLFDRDGSLVDTYRSTNVNDFEKLLNKLDELLAGKGQGGQGTATGGHDGDSTQATSMLPDASASHTMPAN